MIIRWIFLVAGIAGLLTVGIVAGFLLADRSYRTALMNLGHFARRMIGKAFLRTLNTSNVSMLEHIDAEHSTLSVSEKLKHADPSALQAARVFNDRLKLIFGEELLALYFFGSRMRGSYVHWSDLDVVIFFGPETPLVRARRYVWQEVFNILLQHGLLIQPRLANDQVLNALEAEPHRLIRRAVDTGILIA